MLTSNVDDFIKNNVREQFCEIRQWEESRQDELIVLAMRLFVILQSCLEEEAEAIFEAICLPL